MRRQVLILFLILAAFSQATRSADQVLLITLDGLRWQELFSGADAELINDPTFTRDPEATKKQFWRDTPEARRQALMPFFWSTTPTVWEPVVRRPSASMTTTFPCLTVPCSSGKRVAAVSSNVDFPAPLAPTSATSSPPWTSRV